MSLLTVRQKFIELSGRHDLVVDVTDYVDNGANFYIQSGQKMLDRMINFRKSKASYFERVGAGVWSVTFPLCRAVKNVWVNNTTGRSRLEPKDYNWLREEFASLITSTDRGTPAYFCRARMRAIEDDSQNLGSFFTLIEESLDLHGIIILPPPDEAVVIEVEGLFYSDALTADTSTSFWTENESDILVWASLYKLEVSYRNSEGAKDWLASIKEALKDLDMDEVEDELSDDEYMEG